MFRRGDCEICQRWPVDLVHDRCPRHEKYRGWICLSCNGRMRGIDGLWRPHSSIHWSQPDPVEPYLDWYRRCPDCKPMTRRVTYKRISSQRKKLFGLPSAQGKLSPEDLARIRGVA